MERMSALTLVCTSVHMKLLRLGPLEIGPSVRWAGCAMPLLRAAIARRCSRCVLPAVDDEPSTASSGNARPATPPVPLRSVIILDWDDTLMCTTAVKAARVPKYLIDDLSMAVESMIKEAKGLAETVIVTNANAAWVGESARMYMPTLLPILEGVKVFSGRAHSEEFPKDPIKWKELALNKVVSEALANTAAPGVNMVVIGDQVPEMSAARRVRRALGSPSLAKVVKFKEEPTVLELTGQLRRAIVELPSLLAAPGLMLSTSWGHRTSVSGATCGT